MQLVGTATLGLILTALAATITASNVTGNEAGLAAVGRASMVAVPIAVGLYAWYQRPRERFGRMLVLVGVGWFLTTLSESSDELLYSIGRVSGWCVELGLVWLVLSYPSGRLTTRTDRALFGAGLALLAVLFLPTALVTQTYPAPSPWGSCRSCPGNAFDVLGSGPSFVTSVVQPLREVLVVLLFVLAAARLAQRMLDATTVARRALAPVLAVAAARLLLAALLVVSRRADESSPVVTAFAWAVALGTPAIAAAFLLGLVRQRLYGATAMQWLGLRVRQNLTSSELRDALAEALEDPSLRVVFRDNGDTRHWVDEEGHPVELPGPGSGRFLREVPGRGSLVAGVIHDEALRDQREYVEAATSYVLIAMENRRLTAKVEASLREVRASRARILATADRERLRIERDLHDGAQQRLVALRIQLELAEELVQRNPERGREKLHLLAEEVGATLEEIRALARGVYPSLLADRGLAEALRAAALRLPVEAIVHPDGVGRYPQQVESAVYFCCLEAMQNASKHARTAHLVTITLGQDDALHFEVHDDGAGFDHTAPHGVGITNMRDRLAAVGGSLTIRSDPEDGTVVSGTVPVP